MITTTVRPWDIVRSDNRSLTWYLFCRTAVVTFLLGGAALLNLKGESGFFSVYSLLFLILVSYLQAIISSLVLYRIKNKALYSQIQVVWDLLFVTILVVLSGGVDSFFAFAYLLVIVAASFLLSRRMTLLSAACAVILFGGILDLQYFGYLDFYYPSVFNSPASAYLSAIFVHSAAFFLTAVLSGTLAEKWRQSDKLLLQQQVDYAELEKLNRAILFQINSGLMMLNPSGEIRTFNRSASEITGYSLREVSGRNFKYFFSELFVDFSRNSKVLNRSECGFRNRAGTSLILGYATTPIIGSQGEYLGVLVTFQDLTQVRKNEEDLKRVDRLAAVGRLAAGLAHEIRNPLASISGSVQMLAEDRAGSVAEQRLMGIVVKETDRLNKLLTDFLSFAKPRQPETQKLELDHLMRDFLSLVRSDGRFSKIAIEADLVSDLVVAVDREMVMQALWDLFVNASDAMCGEGNIYVALLPDPSPTVIVEDDGPGISDEIAANIFEPFFSTKEQGTGLGLAAVYAIMEAHQGMLTVEKSHTGGAKFKLMFQREDI